MKNLGNIFVSLSLHLGVIGLVLGLLYFRPTELSPRTSPTRGIEMAVNAQPAPRPLKLLAKTSPRSSVERRIAAPLAEPYPEHRPPPEYPEFARQRGWTGQVIMEVGTDLEGRPSEVKLAESSGYALLDEAAIAAVRKWRMRPLSRLSIPILFRLQSE